MVDLSDRVVVVTGAGGNLGQGVSARLAQAGAACVLLERSRGRVGEPGERTFVVEGLDLTEVQAVRDALDRAKTRFGRLDALVATAGGFEGGAPVHETDWDAWERMLTVNLR